MSECDVQNINVCLAECALRSDSIPQALAYIADAMDNTDECYRNRWLAFAAQSYLRAWIKDKAYRYAMELIHSEDPNNQKPGYEVLLSNSLLPLSPPDSIALYARAYQGVIEAYLNSHNAQETMVQNALYNYSVHDRERFTAQRDKQKTLNCIIACSGVILILSLGVLYLFHKAKRQTNRLIGYNTTSIALYPCLRLAIRMNSPLISHPS